MSVTVADCLAVAVGSAAGGVCRHLASSSSVVAAAPGGKLRAVMAINVVGSFSLGALAAAAPVPPRLRSVATLQISTATPTARQSASPPAAGCC